MSEFTYATEAALFADYAKTVPDADLERFREFMRNETLAQEVIYQGERCWQFPTLAECRADFERRRGPRKWRNPSAEWK